MLAEKRHIISKFCILQRYLFAIVGCLGMAVWSMIRMSLNLAIPHMTNGTIERDRFDDNACPVPNSWTNVNASSYFDDEKVYPFDWPQATQNHVIGGFGLGYTLTQIIGGMLSEEHGSKVVLGVGMTLSSICTLITPFITNMADVQGLRILRLITGLTIGPILPALFVMLSFWAPETERARMSAIVFGGVYIGDIVGNLLGDVLLQNGNWEAVFYVFGAIGGVWSIIWYFTCFSTPNTHTFISDSEKKFLNENVIAVMRSTKYKWEPFPWPALVRTLSFWAVVVSVIGHEWGLQTIRSHLPEFMYNILQFDINSNRTLRYLPMFVIWLSTICFGFLCDFGVKRGLYTTGFARKLFTSIAAFGPAICIIMAMYSNCNTTLALFSFFAGMALMGAYGSGMFISALEIAPNYSGTVSAVVDNSGINIGNLLPMFVNSVTADPTFSRWQIVLWVVICVMVVTNVFNLVYAKSEQLWWDDVREHGYPVEWKHGLLPAATVIDLAKTREDAEPKMDV